MFNKEKTIFVSLFLVFFAAMGLLVSIIFRLNIPLALGVGAALGIIVGSITDLVIIKNKNSD